MTHRSAYSLPKWPFLAGDVVFLATAWWIVSKSPDPFAFWPLSFLVGCVAAGAWVSVFPFVAEFRLSAKLAEADGLTSVVRQIARLDAVADQVAGATSQWQEVQEQSAKTIAAAREISERMAAEARAFTDFMEKANDSEKSHLRLEVEKSHRAESEWLQVLVLILDHVHALHMAGLRSGKATLIQQLANFQRACRESARRVGLVPIEVAPGAPFDEQAHVLEESQPPPRPDSCVAETLAPGYTFQGRLVRRPLVRTAAPEAPTNQSGDLFGAAPEIPASQDATETTPPETREAP